tara:strand:+ start:606 stop:1040 length:435 start_codon:yes stop_codon:yes gene_type:complete
VQNYTHTTVNCETTEEVSWLLERHAALKYSLFSDGANPLEIDRIRGMFAGWGPWNWECSVDQYAGTTVYFYCYGNKTGAMNLFLLDFLRKFRGRGQDVLVIHTIMRESRLGFTQSEAVSLNKSSFFNTDDLVRYALTNEIEEGE